MEFLTKKLSVSRFVSKKLALNSHYDSGQNFELPVIEKQNKNRIEQPQNQCDCSQTTASSPQLHTLP